MTAADGCSADLDPLLAYLFDELEEREAATFEDHLFSCAPCGERLATLEGLRAGVADAARHAEIGANVNSAFLERAADDGLSLRDYRIPAGETVDCRAGPEDLVVVRLAAPFGGLERFELDTVLEDLGHGGAALSSRDVVADRARDEVILVFPGEQIRALPRSRWTMRLRADGPAGRRDFGPFVMDHTP